MNEKVRDVEDLVNLVNSLSYMLRHVYLNLARLMNNPSLIFDSIELDVRPKGWSQ